MVDKTSIVDTPKEQALAEVSSDAVVERAFRQNVYSKHFVAEVLWAIVVMGTLIAYYSLAIGYC